MAEEREEFVSRGKTGRQKRRVRKDGWSARKIQIFLDHYAESGNAAEACRAAGMYEGAAYGLRRRDPDFARQYDEAHAVSKLRLEELTILYAKTRGRVVPVEPGEIAPVDLANFDPELALRILSRNRPSQNPSARAVAKPRRASKEELIEAVVKLLGVLKRRRAKRAAS